MPDFLIRRTWPCGAQESLEAKNLDAMPKEDDKLRLCFQHGRTCHRGIKETKEAAPPVVQVH